MGVPVTLIKTLRHAYFGEWSVLIGACQYPRSTTAGLCSIPEAAFIRDARCPALRQILQSPALEYQSIRIMCSSSRKKSLPNPVLEK
jgi:hypothetical protein